MRDQGRGIRDQDKPRDTVAPAGAVRASVTSFRDLRVWQLGMDLVEYVYAFTRSFPKHEVYGLTGQMQRAVISIPSNIAEGHSRRYRKEYLHHLSVAQASLAELETQIEIAARLRYTSEEQTNELLDRAVNLRRQLHSLRNALTAGSPPK